jgi:hypothetical protein
VRARRQHEQSGDVRARVAGERAVRLPRRWRARTPCRGRDARGASRCRRGGPARRCSVTSGEPATGTEGPAAPAARPARVSSRKRYAVMLDHVPPSVRQLLHPADSMGT